VEISRDQVIKRLRAAGYSFKRKGKKNEIYRQSGSGQRVNLATRKKLEVDYVRIVLTQAGLTREEIDKFVAAAVK
jgi:hypothetical protein